MTDGPVSPGQYIGLVALFTQLDTPHHRKTLKPSTTGQQQLAEVPALIKLVNDLDINHWSSQVLWQY